jgi:dimeric dUTPase (all-alpha-NTP-PPase superfamily)
MDKLEEIFYLQSAFDRELHEKRRLENIGFDEWMQKETLAIVSELCEMLRETNFKWWKNPKETDMDAVKGELVDVLHFFISMCIKTGMTADELHSLYLSKNRENFDRQHGKTDKDGYAVRITGI